MLLGAFGKIKDYEAMAKARYDYAELDMPELEALSEEDFAKFCDLVAKTKLPCLTGARILPIAEPTFFLDNFKPDDLSAYLKRSCQRAKQLGISKVILGNGKARSLPTPESIKNEGKFFDLLKIMSEIAGENEQELILEPLGPKYSNYINTISQAVEIIDKLGINNLYTMADLRHMVWSSENLSSLSDNIEYIHHIHIDYPLSFPSRGYPKPSDDYDYNPFIQAILKSGYKGTLTIEADIPEDWYKAHDSSMKILKDLFK